MPAKSTKNKNLPIENQRVAEIRGSMTQEDFAAKLEMSVDNIRKIERGEIGVTLKTAKILHNKCGVSLDYIYGYTDDTNDDASLMLLYLKKAFSLTVDKNQVYKIAAKNSAMKFIDKYEYATKLFESGEIPLEAYQPWVEKLKADFNASFESDNATVILHVMLPERYNEIEEDLKMYRLEHSKIPAPGVGSNGGDYR